MRVHDRVDATGQLLVAIDRGSGVGLRTQLEEQLRTAIRAGRLAADEPRPLIRRQ